jgi:repressor LexA
MSTESNTPSPQEPRGRQLTRKQREVLTSIQRFSAMRGYMPSVRELGRELGGLAPATVQHHLSTLRKKGYLDHDGSAHGVRLAGFATPIPTAAPLSFEKGDGPARPSVPSLNGYDDATDWDSAPSMQVVVPLLGTLTAGKPLGALEESDEYVPVPASLAKGSAFALRVSGNSLIEDGIYDGDVVVVQPGERVESGQVAVVLLADDTATLKRVHLERDHRIRLQPANNELQNVIVESVRVRGRVTGLIRQFS